MSGAPLAALAFGYLLGTIPFGLVVTRLAGAVDPRSIGSGNIGATNVLRSGSKGLAALTLLGDALKGTLAVLVARHLAGEGAALAAALGAFLGHLFPVWLRFRGGKGVATLLGVLLGLWWPAALAFAGAWVATAFAGRRSSLAALVASAVAPAVLALGGRSEAAVLAAVLATMLWIAHRTNIARLLAGTEPRIGAKSPATGPTP